MTNTLQKEQEEKPEGVNFVTSEDAVFVYKNYSPKQDEVRTAYRASQKMPDWAMKEDVVISGMSGRFPESDSVKEFEDNLYNNVDMVVEDERRWPFGYLGLPKGCGKLKDISLFDHRFFHVSEYEANYMDSQVRIMLEITFEALWDAGLDPGCLAGTQTGFFLGNCFDEYLAAYSQDYTRVPDYRQCFFGMLSNVYDFRGPTKHYDTACASGFSALHEAVVSLRSGQCERAIVVGLNLCLRAATQNQFLNLNMISPDGHCKCLDDDANGYAKGEACVAMILQRKSEAKRVYATVVHTKTNCDGYKDLGITYPSFELQRELIEDTYHEVGINPHDVEFCEAHCTGTQAGDPSEMRAIYEALCKGRTTPLLIGAIKSVIGHTEASSGLCSLVKTILSFERGVIPANLHMQKPNHRIEGLLNGMLKPVNTNTPYTGRYAALNCFGFGGVNVHAVVEKHHDTELKMEGSEANLPAEQCLPRLVTFCGRNQAMLDLIVDYMKNNPKELTPAFLSLLSDVSKTTAFPNRSFKGMRHRAFLMLQEEKEGGASVVSDSLHCNKIKDKVRPPVCFVFTGMGSQWTAMGAQLAVFPVVKAALEKCSATLKTLNPSFDLMHLLTADDDELLKSPLNSFVAIAAIQIAVVDLLASLDITAEYIVGHSIGELTCAYADGCLTAEETIAAAYWRGVCIEQAASGGAMAAVACSWQEAQEWCTSLAGGKVWPACHNGEDSVTVAGKAEDVEAFIEKLQTEKEGVFARQVNSSGVAFHSPLVEGIRGDLLGRLTKVLGGKPTRERSARWISSTYEQEKEEKSSSLLDAKYLVENLILPVRFHAALQQVPSSAVFLEIGPHHLLQAIIKRTLMGSGSPVKYVASLSRQGDNPRSLLTMLGGLYACGLNPSIERLYPKVLYPVPRTTASLHSLFKWRHDRSFTVTQYPKFFNQTKLYESARTVDTTVGEEKFLTDHCIDSRVLFPATGYLFLAWTHVAKLLNVDYRELPVVFEDVNLHRATIIPKIGFTNFDVYFIENTGLFTITEGGMLTTSGKIRVVLGKERSSMLQHQSLLKSIKKLQGQSCQMEMKTKDIYKEFRLRGYDYGPEFQAVTHIRQVDKTLTARVIFKNWITYVDGLIQLAVLGQKTRGLFLPVRFNMLRCDPKLLFGDVAGNAEAGFGSGAEENGAPVVRVFDAIYDGVLNIGVAPGIEYQGIKANLAPRKVNQKPVEETFEFVAHDELDLPYIASRAVSEKRVQLMTDQLKCYQDMCTGLLTDRAKLSEEQLAAFLDKYEKVVAAAPVLLKLTETLAEGSDLKAIESLEQDLLFRTYLTERFMRSQLETFTDNLTEPSVQVLEVNQTPTILANSILNWLLLSSFKVTFTYGLLHSGLNKFALNLDSTHSQHEWLAEKSKFPTDLVNIGLIVYKDASTCPLLALHKVNFDSLLDSMWNALQERGFALIILRDRPFEVEKKLAVLLKKTDNCLIEEGTSRVAEFEAAIEKSPLQVVSHKSDVFGVHVYMVRKIAVEIVVDEQIFMNVDSSISTWFTDLQEKIREICKVEEVNGAPGDTGDTDVATTTVATTTVTTPTTSANNNRNKNIWLLANDANSGVIGFISCLHKEPLGTRVRCILNTDTEGTPAIDLQSATVQKIIKQDLFMNTLGPKGVPGGYKHFTLPLEDYEPRPTEHCYINASTRGDLSSLKWFESQHKHWPVNSRPNQILCHVYYSALNFRDIMLATGKLPPDALPAEIGLDDCVLGLEFAGRDQNGNRVMGMLAAKGLATTLIMEHQNFLWPVPPHWSMEEAATVPVAYATAYYALLIRGKMQPGEAVLIHSGSGAVGQAAIAIAVDMNCRLFITVGSDEKRDILMQIFPSLKANQFASSRSIEFSRKILQETNGRGVDLVLNSLAEEKLQESVNCLAEFGRFLEIGKYDLSQNTDLDLSKIMANKTFHGILLDNLLNFGPETPQHINNHRALIWKLMRGGIEKGVVRPLDRTIFSVDQAEEAFRYMANGKHIGKVLVCIRPEEKVDEKGVVNVATELKLPAIPRTVFLSTKSYIITGGLGGFGLELINWMVEREARNFVVTSRSGVKDLYQKTRLEHFARLGAKVKIFTGDASVESGADELVKEAESLAPLGGVFHLAMVLSDGLFDNQTVASFEAAVKPKADTFTHLDRITRKRCTQVDYFVAFSSVSCGVGNPGQTNYGFANSVMERICEQRRRQGLHGFAIQWGAIGDVGYIIDNIRGNEVVICGSIPQRMPSCLAALDRLLQSPFSVCSNLIKMDYKFESCGKSSLIKTVAHILGIKDYETLEAKLTLGELGMDSLMGVEVKQAIERDYDVVLSMGDVRKLTIGKIREIGAGQAKNSPNSADPSATGEGDRPETSIDETLMPSAAVTYLNDIVNGDPIIFLPQIDATYEQMLPLAAKLNRPAIGLNWTKECKDLKTVHSTAAHFIEVIERTLPHLESNYDLLGYSFGGIIAIEMNIQLHNRPPAGRLGPSRKLILLDSSPKQFKFFTEEAVQKFKIYDKTNDQAFVETILMFLLAKLPIDYAKIKETLLSLEDTAKRIEFVRDLFKQMQGVDIQSETLEFLIQSHYNKMAMINQYECQEKSLPGDVMLIRASKSLVVQTSGIVNEDYWLSEIITGKCHLHVLPGDHKTFITDNYPQLTELVRTYYEL